MMRFRWPAWRALAAEVRAEIVHEAARGAAAHGEVKDGRQSAVFSLLGHKGDLMFVHFRRSFEELNQARAATGAAARSATTWSRPLVPLDRRAGTVRIHLEGVRRAGGARESQPHSEEWKTGDRSGARAAAAGDGAAALAGDSAGEVSLFLSHGPANAAKSVNWYTEPMADRQRMMHEHGMVGRRYAGEVRQIITGRSGSTTGNGASICSPKIRWSSKS